jgi:3-hydroxyisobutyrate dehydrogenase
MVNQIVIDSGLVELSEALVYAARGPRRGARDRDDLRTCSRSVVALELRPRMLGGDFELGFKVDHLVKNIGIALAEARRSKLALPGLALAEQLYVSLQAQGRGQRGVRALALPLARLSVVDCPAVDRDWAGPEAGGA